MNWNKIPDEWKKVLIYTALVIILLIVISLIMLQAILSEYLIISNRHYL